MIGQTISHYEITAKLGAGGMGVVYLATDTKLGRQVALKFLPESLARDPEARERLLREAKAASRLNHPNILTVHAVEEADGRDFIAMEYIEGQSLNGHLDAKGRTVERILSIAIQIAAGLEKAHGLGIVHRDIKPENILFDQDGRLKICDFGLATIRGTTKITKDHKTIGTARYMSPEQATGQTVDHRSDIWSLGVVLYEMLAGRVPFAGDYDQAIIYAILNEDPPPVNAARDDLPPELTEIVRRALQKDVAARYQQVAELRADLEGLRQKITAPATGSGAGDFKTVRSVAVLPFANMSADPDNEYFSDGLAEELINALTKLPGLQVASRTSSFSFKGKEIDIREIGRKLNVGTVLEGSVRKAGNRLRITGQLINVANGYHLWSERYDREMEDIFAIQDEISQAITKALRITLLAGQETSLVQRHTADIEAYNLNLKGRYFWGKRTSSGLRKGIECFDAAIARDPEYAPAHIGLADSYSLLCAYHILPPGESIPQAQKAAAHAMRIDASSAEAHEAVAHVRILDDWNWTAAETEFRRAIEINPAYATAHQRYALLLTVMGRQDEALATIERARKLEPLSLILNTDVALVHYIARRYDEAIDQCAAVLEMDPGFGVAQFVYGLALEGRGHYDEAIAAFHKASIASGGLTVMTGALGHAYGAAGRADDAQMILEEAEEMAAERYVSPYSIATIHAGLGHSEKALDWFERAAAEKSAWLIHLHMAVDPRLDRFRSEPRFLKLLERLGIKT